MSCEYCWAKAAGLGVSYSDVLARAELEGWPCTKITVQGAMLRAGQFWDEGTQTDTRHRATSGVKT